MPAAGVSNLQALAFLGTGERRAAVLDARRGEVYAALFDGDCKLLTPEVVAPLEEWKQTLPEGEISFIFQEDRRLAGAMALLAAGQARHPAALDANYVRKSDAEMAWSDR